MTPPDKTQLFRGISQFTSKPQQNAGLGDTDGTGSHFKIGGNVTGSASLDDNSPECLPGPVVKLATDGLQCLSQQLVQNSIVRHRGRFTVHIRVKNLL